MSIIISPKHKIAELRIGKIALVIWKTYRWRAAVYVGYHRFAL